MVRAAYVPDAGDIVYIDFDPQAGREQAKRRPALVMTPRSYNAAASLAVMCPVTSRLKPYPFALPIHIKGRERRVLVDHLKSLDWQVREAAFYDKAPEELLAQARKLLGVLLGLS